MVNEINETFEKTRFIKGKNGRKGEVVIVPWYDFWTGNPMCSGGVRKSDIDRPLRA